MYIGQDFSDMDVGEVEVFGFDFARELVTDEKVLSTTWSCTVAEGKDATPAARLNGGAQMQGTKSLQKISGMIAGTRYLLMATVTTDQDNIKSLWSFVTCVKPA
jgi:hypothetical protein